MVMTFIYVAQTKILKIWTFFSKKKTWTLARTLSDVLDLFIFSFQKNYVLHAHTSVWWVGLNFIFLLITKAQ